MKSDWKTCFRVAATAFCLFLAINYWESAANLIVGVISASTPLMIGAVIAYLVNILMTLYEKRFFIKSKKSYMDKIRRPVCMLLSFLTLFVTVALVFTLVIPQLAKAAQLLIDVVPDKMSDLIAWIDEKEFLPASAVESVQAVDWESRLGGITKTVLSGIGNVTSTLISVVSGVFSGIVTFLIALIFSIYILLGKEKLANQIDRIMKHYISEKWYGRIMYFLRTANTAFRNYTVGQCIEAVILGVLCALGMLIMGLPYAGMSGALIAFTALIPIAGAYIGGGICAFMIFTVSPVQALVFLIYLVVLQEFEGNIIYPRVVGSSVGLPGIWVLAAVTVGGGVMGVPGMLLGVPLAATFYKLFKDDMKKKPKGNNAEGKHV